MCGKLSYMRRQIIGVVTGTLCVVRLPCLFSGYIPLYPPNLVYPHSKRRLEFREARTHEKILRISVKNSKLKAFSNSQFLSLFFDNIVPSTRFEAVFASMRFEKTAANSKTALSNEAMRYGGRNV